MSQYSRYSPFFSTGGGGGGGGVTSLNGETGAVNLIAGSGITITPVGQNITIAAPDPGDGTVTSVALTAPSSILTVTGSPITTAGTLALSLVSQSANTVFAAPNGAAGNPSFRPIVSADIPTLNQNTTGTASNITATSNSTLTTLSVLSLPGSQVTGNISGNAANVTGVVAIANGGTNSSTALNNNRVMESIGGSIVEAAAITANMALISDANGLPIASATTNIELGFVSGVTSPIQTQLNNKQTSGLSWLLLGNLGTTAGTNFLGTTDAQSLVFKTNSVEAMRIDQPTSRLFIGTASSIGASNSGIQYADATTANRGQIKLHSYFNGTSIAGVSTLTSRSGVVGTNAAVVAGQDYSKWTAQAAATTSGSAPISGTFSFKANTVNSLTVTSDYHIQLANLAGTLGDRLYLTSEGILQLPNYGIGAAVFDASGNISSIAPGASGNLLTSNGTTWISSPSGGITALTGDATASGPGSAVLTLATVNANVGSFGSVSSVGVFTVNGKGLITAASNSPIQIAESQVTNLVSDLAGKQSLLTFSDSLVNSSGTVTLVNDVLSPSASQYYGTNGSSVRGYFNLPSPGTGTVTSVALTVPGVIFNSPVAGSPITTSGTFALALNTQTANTVFAGPASGGAATPTFRALVAADIPSISLTAGIAGVLPIANGGTNSGTALANNRVMESIGGQIIEAPAITANSALISDVNGLPIASTTTAAELAFVSGVTSSIQTQINSKGSGTVTSVALTVPGVIFNSPVAGSPITTAGTLALALNTQTANTVFAGPSSGGAATPTFRPLVAADIPSLTSTSISNFTVATQTVASGSATKKIIYVSQDVGNDANDGSIFLPFKTIQAGINKANTIAAYLAQVIVSVTPSAGGTGYNENITLSQQGVHLIAAADPLLRTDACLITGTITVNLTGTSGGVNFLAGNNDVYIKGFVTTSGASDGITFSGTTFQRLWLANMFVQSLSGGSAIVVSNTGVSAGSVKSTVTSYDCTYLNSSSTIPTASLTAGRFWNYGVNAAIQNNNAAGHSVDESGTSSLICDTVGFTGQVNVTSNVATCTITTSTIASGALAAIATPASPNTGTIVIGNVGITTTAANSITGAGVLVFAGANVKLSSGGDAAPAITQVVFPKFPEGQTLLGAKATAVTNSLLVLNNGHITSQQTTAPAIAVNANAGTGAIASVSNATDTAGVISITTGTVGISTGAYATITFNKPYNVAPICVLTPAGSSLSTSVYVTTTTTTMTINFGVAGGVSTNYLINYLCIGTQ